MRLLRAAWAFLIRDFQTEVSYRLAFVLSLFGLFVSTTLWYFMAGFIEGGDPARLRAQTGGLPYFAWVLPGLMVNRFMDVALGSYGSQIRQEQTTGTLEAMLITPTRLGHIVLASSAYSFLFAAIQAAVYLAYGTLLFGLELNLGSVVGALCAVAFSVVALSGLGIISAGFVLYFKRGNPLDFVISSLNLLFGGVIIPPAALPANIAWISSFVPMYHANEAVRGAMVRGEGLGDLGPHLLALAAFAAVLVPFGLFGARIAVRRAKKEGSLIQY
ncbi:MAG: ABC transporter permease [Acidobacteria bacterium]|nr:ABC transporter permease [Acidobacteriota bacterium]